MKKITAIMLITLATMSTQARESSNYVDTKDYKQELSLNSEAAKHGNAEAQFNLGVMYSLGQGVKQDYQQAAKWYEKAAEQQGESVNILLNFTQFFETRIEYRFQIFTAHSCDFLLPSYARLA